MIAVASENTCVDPQVSPVSELVDLQQLRQEIRTLHCDRNYYKTLHEKAKAREDLLKQENQQLNARIRYLEQKLYGRNSEKKTSSEKNTSTSSSNDDPSKRNRGQQKGSPGHGRRDYSHLPVEEESYELDEAICPKCGCPLHEDPRLGTEDSETIEIEVKAYRRKAKRKKYKKVCQCEDVPGIITAPGPAKLIGKGKLGISVWVHLLLENSIKEHWDGLLVFVDYPWIPMDNSEAERRMYTVALGRKNYYGSGSVWSGHFTASLFSIFQTLKLWNINPRKWLTQYLQACAENRGQTPPDLTCFLPWTMSKEQLARLHYPDTS